METGIISYHNPRNDSVKDVNNSWICNFKAKYLDINNDYKSDFENDIFNLDEARTLNTMELSLTGAFEKNTK